MNVTEYMSALVNTEWWMPANIWMSYLWQPSWRPVETTVLHAGAWYFSYSSSERIFIQLPYSIPQVCHYVPNILTFLLCSLEFSLYEFLNAHTGQAKIVSEAEQHALIQLPLPQSPAGSFFLVKKRGCVLGAITKHTVCVVNDDKHTVDIFFKSYWENEE